MEIYRVYYSGVAYVKADNEDEARQIYWEDGAMYGDEMVVRVEVADDDEVVIP